MIWRSLTQYRDVGLLILRVGIGLMFMLHGWPKLAGGAVVWERVGGALGLFGITFWPAFWGFMAAITEFCGGLLLIAGAFFRPAVLAMAFVMLVASTMHIDKQVTGLGDLAKYAGHPLEMFILFISLLLIGPGKYSADRT